MFFALLQRTFKILSVRVIFDEVNAFWIVFQSALKSSMFTHFEKNGAEFGRNT